MMRRAVMMIAFILFSLPVRAEEARFFRDLSDIPLMSGLYEADGARIVFDKPEGRIIETSALSETENISQIKGFYESALPQLGWRRLADEGVSQVYVRQGERLLLGFESREGLAIVKLTVSPG